MRRWRFWRSGKKRGVFLQRMLARRTFGQRLERKAAVPVATPSDNSVISAQACHDTHSSGKQPRISIQMRSRSDSYLLSSTPGLLLYHLSVPLVLHLWYVAVHPSGPECCVFVEVIWAWSLCCRYKEQAI